MSLADVAKRLASIHDEIRRGLDQLALVLAEENDVRVAADFATELLSFLHEHHQDEDHFLFPAVKRGASMQPAIVAFLDARTSEHVAIDALSQALARAAAMLDHDAIRQTSADLRAQLDPHLLAEERDLPALELSDRFDDAVVAEAEREIQAHLTPESLAHEERFLHHAAWLVGRR